MINVGDFLKLKPEAKEIIFQINGLYPRGQGNSDNIYTIDVLGKIIKVPEPILNEIFKVIPDKFSKEEKELPAIPEESPLEQISFQEEEKEVKKGKKKNAN